MLKGFHLDGTNLLKFHAKDIHLSELSRTITAEKMVIENNEVVCINLKLKNQNFIYFMRETIICTDEFQLC